MDDLEQKRADARAQGYTDAEIDAYLSSSQTPEKKQDDTGATPYVDRGEEKLATTEYGVAKAAEYGLGGYGLYKAGQGIARAFGSGTPAPGPVAPTPPGGAPPPPPPGGASLEPGGQQLKDFVQQRGQYTPPGGAPSPAAPEAPGQAYQRGQAIGEKVREIAFEKIAPTMSKAAPYARAAGGIMALLTPGNVGQDYPFPQSGPLKGQEINPRTGAPWTKQELAAYYNTPRY